MPPELEEGELSTDDILDILNDDSSDESDESDDKSDESDKSDKEEDKSDDKSDEDESDEDDSDEDEEDEEDEDESDDEEIAASSFSRKELLAKYPKLFKEYPQLERAYYRDQKYNDLFGSLDDAREVKEKADLLDEHETSLMKGTTKDVLATIKENDPNTFNQIVDNYLGSLAEVDKDAYLHVISGVLKGAMINAASAAKENQDKDLSKAVDILHEFIFGTKRFTPHTRLSKDKDNDDVENERNEFLRERFETARTDLSSQLESSIRKAIDGVIDPKSSMSAFVKKHAVNEALVMLNEEIKSDASFQRALDRAWEKAGKSKFNQSSISDIRKIYLAKAKTLIGSVVKRSRREALKGSGKSTTKKSRESSRRTPNHSPRKPSNDGTGMSTYDFLMSD